MAVRSGCARKIERVLGSWHQAGPLNRVRRSHRFPTQTVTLSTHVGGWAGYPLVERIERITGAPAVMDNDANVGALGEALYGAGVGADPLFYMTLSTGIGGGIVTNGRVYRGADSYAGEIGHLNIEPEGPDCLCGSRGCYERMCCGLWLERDYGKPAKELLMDPRFVEKYVVHLARGLKAALMLLNPARIVIGGASERPGCPICAAAGGIGTPNDGLVACPPREATAALGDDSVLWARSRWRGCNSLRPRASINQMTWRSLSMRTISTLIAIFSIGAGLAFAATMAATAIIRTCAGLSTACRAICARPPIWSTATSSATGTTMRRIIFRSSIAIYRKGSSTKERSITRSTE